MDEPVSVTLYGGTAAVHHEQGQGQIAFTVTATRDQIAAGSEWAVIVTGNRRGTVGQGTITVDAPEPPAPEAGALDTWLRAHPAVAFHLTWNDGERSRSYSAWPAEMREALGSAVEAARAGRFSLADDPPANAWKRASDDPDAVHTAFAPEVARALYIATVAHSLAVEIDRRVPWSLDDLNGDELETLLASSSLFGWNPEQRGYEISEFDHGWATPAQPATSWAFLQQQRLLASSRLDTIVALVGWSRNLTHFAGPVSRQNFREHWGYDGDMPVARALSGTRYTGTVFASIPGYDAVRHYTAGCQGTAGLFASVLRAANIPVRLRSVSNDSTPHATILFLSEDRGLSHGDDPYSLLSEGAPPADLLIDLSTYEKWLGSTSKDAGRYIGRQSQALALQRLPPIVRRTHERDRQQGLAPEQSGVYALFKGSYFMAELLEARLWERLELARTAGTEAPVAAPYADRWFEAESASATVTAGTAAPQPLDPALLGLWRNQQQLRWSDARPGAELSLPCDLAESGTYRISVRFTRPPDYAVVAVRLDDKPAALDRVGLYAPQIVAADPLTMGDHTLTAGPHRLRFTIVGAHPMAKPDYVVGIDAIRLERLK